MQQSNLRDSVMVLVGASRRRIKQVAWDALKPWGVTPQQCGVLLTLLGEGSLSLGALAEGIGSDNPTASRICNKLLVRNLVNSRMHGKDRRRCDFTLTASGKKLSQGLLQTANDLMEAAEAGFSEEDRRTIRCLLRRVIANMDALTEVSKRPRAKAPSSESGEST